MHVDAALHTHHVDPLVPALAQALNGLRPSAGTVPFYSSVTGALKSGDGCDARYWVANLRQPVLFCATPVPEPAGGNHQRRTTDRNAIEDSHALAYLIVDAQSLTAVDCRRLAVAEQT